LTYSESKLKTKESSEKIVHGKKERVHTKGKSPEERRSWGKKGARDPSVPGGGFPGNRKENEAGDYARESRLSWRKKLIHAIKRTKLGEETRKEVGSDFLILKTKRSYRREKMGENLDT